MNWDAKVSVCVIGFQISIVLGLLDDIFFIDMDLRALIDSDVAVFLS